MDNSYIVEGGAYTSWIREDPLDQTKEEWKMDTSQWLSIKLKIFDLHEFCSPKDFKKIFVSEAGSGYPEEMVTQAYYDIHRQKRSGHVANELRDRLCQKQKPGEITIPVGPCTMRNRNDPRCCLNKLPVIDGDNGAGPVTSTPFRAGSVLNAHFGEESPVVRSVGRSLSARRPLFADVTPTTQTVGIELGSAASSRRTSSSSDRSTLVTSFSSSDYKQPGPSSRGKREATSSSSKNLAVQVKRAREEEETLVTRHFRTPVHASSSSGPSKECQGRATGQCSTKCENKKGSCHENMF